MSKREFKIIVDSSDPDLDQKIIDLITTAFDHPVFQVKTFTITEVEQDPVLLKSYQQHRYAEQFHEMLLKSLEVPPLNMMELTGEKIEPKRTKQSRVEYAKEVFDIIGISYKTYNHNMHFIVEHMGKVVDYWPTTGRWRDRSQQKPVHGFKNLLQHLGVPKNVYKDATGNS